MGIAASACWLALSLALFVSCKGVGPSPSPPVVSPRNSPCDGARHLREQAKEAYTSGKLDRTLRIVHKANRLCAEEAASSSQVEQQALRDLGLDLGNPIRPVAGQQWLQEGLDKKARGDFPAAQRLFDRARIVLERQASGKAVGKVVLEPKVGIWDVSAMTWAADGSKVAVAAGLDIHILRADDYQEILRLQTDASPVVAVAFSPDSQTLASSAADHKIALWDLRSGARVGNIASDRGAVQTLSFSPDGQLLAGRDGDSANIDLWSPATRAHVRTLEARLGDEGGPGLRGGAGDVGKRPEMVAFSPDGKDLLGVHDQTLALWTLPSGKSTMSRVLKATARNLGDDELSSVAYHPDGRTAVSGTESGKILLWNLAKGTTSASVQAHAFNAQVAFSREGHRLLSVAGDGIVRTFDGRSLAPLATYDTKMGWVSATALHPDASRAALAGEGALVIQDVMSGTLSRPMDPGPPMTAIAVSADVRHLAMGTRAGTVVVFSTSDGSLSELTGHTGEVTSLAFSKDGSALASASRDKTARIWNVSTRSSRRVLAHPQAVNSVAFRADGQTVATGSEDGMVRLWNIDGADEPVPLPGGRCAILTVAFSPDGSMVLANTGDHSVVRWNVDTHARLPRVEREYACSGELRSWSNTLGTTADGKVVASAPSGDVVELWSAQTGQLQGSLTQSAHNSHLRSVAVSPRDPIVVAAGDDGIKAWHLPDKTELPALAVPGGADSLVFSSDGRFLFGASNRGAVSIWSMPAGRLEVTLRLVGDASAYAVSASGLVEWLGSKKPEAACRLNERLYPAELCEERFMASGLVGAVLSGRGVPALDD